MVKTRGKTHGKNTWEKYMVKTHGKNTCEREMEMSNYQNEKFTILNFTFFF